MFMTAVKVTFLIFILLLNVVKGLQHTTHTLAFLEAPSSQSGNGVLSFAVVEAFIIVLSMIRFETVKFVLQMDYVLIELVSFTLWLSVRAQFPNSNY